MPVGLIIATVLDGVTTGLMYALFASGLTLIWGTMKMLNFAHGEFFMLGGYLTFVLFMTLHWPILIATVGSVMVVILVALLIEAFIIQPLLRRPLWQLTSIIATLGLSVIMQNLALHIWGPQFLSIPYYFSGVTKFGNIPIANQRLLIAAVSILALLGSAYVIRYTRIGMALRATSQDADAAKLYGVHVAYVYAFTFAMAAGLAGVAVAVMAPITSVNPFMGLNPLLKGFIVVILGGLGSFPGAIVGGIVLGVIEALGVLFTSSQWQDVIGFGVLVLILWVRPWGLFGVEERT